MKKMLVVLLALSASLLACGPCGCNAQNASCGQKAGCNAPAHGQGKSLRPLFYALDIMGLRDHSEISLAIQSYRMNMRSLDRSLNTDAFKDGKFDRERFVKEHAMAKKIDAQAELFETIYTVLDDDQKKRLHQLMSADVYYWSQRMKSCDDKPCGNRACDGTAPNPDCPNKACGQGPRDGSGPNPDCPKKR